MTLPATPKGSWISKDLEKVYGAKRWKAGKGVDLNGNGRLENIEKIATYNRNKIPGNDRKVVGDWTDWLAFYRANYKTIHRKTRNNKNSIFYWAAKFKTTNPLHIITSIESPVIKQADVLKAYKKTWKIIARARKIPIKGSTKLKRAKAKLLTVISAMTKNGIQIKSQYRNHLFVGNMSRTTVDCDTSSYPLVAAAHENGWPVFLVQAPWHIFVRWDDRRSRINFNMDTSPKVQFLTNSKYRKDLKISSTAISKGVYLKNTSMPEIVSMSLEHVGLTHADKGKHNLAIKYFSDAIRLHRKSTQAYINRGTAYFETNNCKLAIRDLNTSINLSPNHSLAYNNRGLCHRKNRDYAKAKRDFKKAISLNPRYSQAYYNLGLTNVDAKEYKQAIHNFMMAVKVGPNNKAAKRKLSTIEANYFKRGLARFKARNFSGASSDFKTVLKINPKHITADALIKRAESCQRNPRKCP